MSGEDEWQAVTMTILLGLTPTAKFQPEANFFKLVLCPKGAPRGRTERHHLFANLGGGAFHSKGEMWGTGSRTARRLMEEH